jgi:hypothetical protein
MENVIGNGLGPRPLPSNMYFSWNQNIFLFLLCTSKLIEITLTIGNVQRTGLSDLKCALNLL